MCINDFKLSFVFDEIKTLVNFFPGFLQANTWFLDSNPFSESGRASNWNPREKNLSITWRYTSPNRTIPTRLIWPFGDLALDGLTFLSKVSSAGSGELASFKRYLEIIVCTRSGVGAFLSCTASLLSKLSS